MRHFARFAALALSASCSMSGTAHTSLACCVSRYSLTHRIFPSLKFMSMWYPTCRHGTRHHKKPRTGRGFRQLPFARSQLEVCVLAEAAVVMQGSATTRL